MNSRFCSGFGEAILTGPSRSSRRDQKLHGPGEVVFVNPRNPLPPVSLLSAETDAYQVRQDGKRISRNGAET